MQKEISTVSRALICDNQLSLVVLNTTSLVREAQKRHRLSKGSLCVLGKTLTAACYLGGWLKGEKSSFTVSVLSDGDFGRISVLGDGNLNVRGYVENSAIVHGRLGSGTLSVVRDDREGLPFAGTVSLVSEEMEDNFSTYFSESEQIETGIALSVVSSGDELVRAGGVILQALPFADEQARAIIKRDMPRLKQYLLAGENERILKEYGAQDIETREAKFLCSCSKVRVESLLLSMGREQALTLCEEDGQISVHCEYCNTDYIFRKEEIEKLFKKHER